MINMQDYIPGSTHFIWHEALYLPSWGVHHQPTDQEQAAIIEQARRLDFVRDFLGKPITVNCWIRPISANTGDSHQGQNYNALKGGATHSTHILGSATDFEVSGMSVDDVMRLITPKLSTFQMSAEANGSAVNRNWIHLQSVAMPDGTYRVFNP